MCFYSVNNHHSVVCDITHYVITVTTELVYLQNVDPVPMYGRGLGVEPDDLQLTEASQETKKEVLPNKDVSLSC